MPATTKGERTRARIIGATARLMNHHGYLATPVAEIVAATGIQKGGLYRHFESREALLYAAFDFAFAQVRERFLRAMAGQTGATGQLLAIIQAYLPDGLDVPLPGGCPIMNSAIEADHAHPGLQARARAAMTAWQRLLKRIVAEGIESAEFRAGIDANEAASVIVGSLEGGVMLTQLYRHRSHLDAAVRHLTGYIERDLRAAGRP